MYHPFSIAETIKAAWNVLKRNFATFIVYSILSLFIYGAVDFLTTFVFFGDTLLSRIIIVFSQMLIQSYLALSFYKLILTLMDREYYEFEFKEIWPPLHMAFRFIMIGLYYTVLVVICFTINFFLQQYPSLVNTLEVIELLLFVYLLIRSIFCVCFIADDDSGTIESLKQSFSITRDNFFNTLGMFLIILGFMIITLIPIVAIISFLQPNANEDSYIFKLAFYIWFVISFPSVQVLIMVTYRKLVYSHQDVEDDINETN